MKNTDFRRIALQIKILQKLDAAVDIKIAVIIGDFMLYLIPLWKRIEVVITSRTRNAVVLTGTWVRIPPLPPRKEELFALCYWCSRSFTTLFTTNITVC